VKTVKKGDEEKSLEKGGDSEKEIKSG